MAKARLAVHLHLCEAHQPRRSPDECIRGTANCLTLVLTFCCACTGTAASALVSHALAALTAQDSLPSAVGNAPPSSPASRGSEGRASEASAATAGLAGNPPAKAPPGPPTLGSGSGSSGGEAAASSRTSSGSLASSTQAVGTDAATAAGPRQQHAERPDILGMPEQPLSLLKKLVSHIKVR